MSSVSPDAYKLACASPDPVQKIRKSKDREAITSPSSPSQDRVDPDFPLAKSWLNWMYLTAVKAKERP